MRYAYGDGRYCCGKACAGFPSGAARQGSWQGQAGFGNARGKNPGVLAEPAQVVGPDAKFEKKQDQCQINEDTKRTQILHAKLALTAGRGVVRPVNSR